ncbi:hypothetical protein BX600DRAFT_19281 [Xylariales sp. PMI_506]|nr:hypothetical protein BX600DRAFT_19281 [Xylariales sp. PMI_506]
MAAEVNRNPMVFSWLDPHPLFVIVLVGSDETPFGIQRDLLCAKSGHYREHFATLDNQELESVLRLPQTTSEVFGLVQSFLYTGKLVSDIDSLPGYEILIAVWKLGSFLVIDGLCDEVLETMIRYKSATQSIPSTPLLVQVWKDTPEGSSIRKLLLNWAAEYIRSSESRAEFSKSLPQEVLSELVVAMSHLNSSPVIRITTAPTPHEVNQRKNVHYLDVEENDGNSSDQDPKRRHSDVAFGRLSQTGDKSKLGRKPLRRTSLPSAKSTKSRRLGIGGAFENQPTTEQKLNFCADLLSRMLSGPGFWTRLVGPFKEPVRPVEDGVPDYLDKVSKPMYLGLIKNKIDDNEYKDEMEFAADVRQIFANCFTYWTKKDPMWTTCEKFQKTFEEKFAGMNKWIAKMEGYEGSGKLQYYPSKKGRNNPGL